MTELSPGEAAAELQAVLDVLDQGGRRCGCDPDLYGDSDFIGSVSDSQGRNHREVHGGAIRVLLADRKQLLHLLANPCGGEDCETGGAGHCHRCAEAEADKLLAQRDRYRAEVARLDAELEEERRLIDGERRAHEARAGAAAWLLERGLQTDGTYRPEPVGEAIRQLRAALDPQRFTTWPEDWTAHRAERDAARVKP